MSARAPCTVPLRQLLALSSVIAAAVSSVASTRHSAVCTSSAYCAMRSVSDTYAPAFPGINPTHARVTGGVASDEGKG